MNHGWQATITADIPVPGRTTSYDLYVPERPWALVVYAHGGGWEAGDTDRPPGFRSLLAAGLAVAAVTYRYSDTASIDGMVDDIRAAAGAAREAMTQLTGEALPWLLWGISAGAHLVLLLAARTVEGENPAAVCSWCGPTDLPSLAALDGVKDHCRADIVRIVNKLVGVDAITPEVRVPGASTALSEPHTYSRLLAWSPLTHVRSGLPPHLMIHGSDDGLVPPHHSRRMHEALLDAGVTSEYFEVPGGSHAMPPSHWEGTDRMIAFFRRAVTGIGAGSGSSALCTPHAHEDQQ